MYFTHKKRVSKDGNDLEIKNSPYLSIIPGNKEKINIHSEKNTPQLFHFGHFTPLNIYNGTLKASHKM
jgi:hypothetical protein